MPGRSRSVATAALVAALAAALAVTAAGADSVRDARIETFLLEGEPISSEPIGSGITGAQKVVLELDGEQMAAAFKTVAMDMSARRAKVANSSSLSFTDDFHYERAAYLLDRALGLDMVPVTVIRRLGREEGALIEWVEDAIQESERRSENVQVDDPVGLFRQRDMMRVFDLLIQNDDRNLGNQLVTPADWKLHLIDHTRSFRLDKKLPDDVEGVPYPLPRWLHQNLQDLELQELKQLLKGLMSGARVKAIIARRDRILEKIEADREQFGDDIIFHEDQDAADGRPAS
jgi:hypothetical protein